MSSTNVLAECSDEENYFDPDVHYRTDSDGRRIFEPSGEELFSMYQTLSEQVVIKLDWQCPGRISPSELNLIRNDDNHQKLDSEKQSKESEPTKTEFDFDIDNDDIDDDDSLIQSSNARVLKKSPVVKKSETTNLTKVMQDIKKYQNN